MSNDDRNDHDDDDDDEEEEEEEAPPRLDPRDVRARAKLVPGCREVPYFHNPQAAGVTPISGISPRSIAGSQNSNSNNNNNNNDDASGGGMNRFDIGGIVTKLSNTIQQHKQNFALSLSSSSARPEVISFLVGTDVNDIARVNIYYRSGTVGVCRVLNGQVRETFRRNCSLDTVERTLTLPPELTIIDEKLVSFDDGEYDDVHENNNREVNDNKENGDGTGKAAMPGARGKKKKGTVITVHKLRKKIDLVDVGIAIMMGEKEKLESHLAHLSDHPTDEEEDDDEEEDQEKKDRPLPRRYSTTDGEDELSRNDDRGISAGEEFEFFLPPKPMRYVEECLDGISDAGEYVSCVATNGRGTIFLCNSGKWVSTPNIPKKLYNKLNGRQKSLPIPTYVSIGTKERYYIAFADGQIQWSGPKHLDRCLETCKTKLRTVAFGSTYDTYFVVFDDGSWQYSGRGIPDALEDKLTDRADRADLVCVTLGPGGEWFIKARNGRMWWGGSDRLDQYLEGLVERDGRELNFVDFGEHGSYFVSYD